MKIVKTPFRNTYGNLVLYRDEETGNCAAVMEDCFGPSYRKISAGYYDISAEEFGEIGESEAYSFEVEHGKTALKIVKVSQETPENDQVALNPDEFFDEFLDPLLSLVMDLQDALEPQACQADPLGQRKLLNKGRFEDLAMHLRVAEIYLKEAIKDADGTITEKEEPTYES